MAGIPVAAVVGPTASGKTGLAVQICRRFGGEVVSADSMQVYRGLDVGTAQPDEEERQGIPHHLIGFLDPGSPFSAADYVAMAGECIADIRSRGKLPVLAGGTGLYVDALLRNLKFTPQAGDEALREELFRRAREQGSQTLVEELRGFDPQSAERIHPNNVGRLVRAIEIYRSTGVTMTQQLARSQAEPSPYDACVIGLNWRDRSRLYAAIDRRVDMMMERGLAREAETVLTKLPKSATARQAIGYKEFQPYFEGRVTLDEAVENVKRESRRYAKRQLTWFRKRDYIRWVYLDDFADLGGVCEEAFRMILERGWGFE